MKVINVAIIMLSLCTMIYSVSFADSIIIDHSCTVITEIPEAALEQAKTDLHIAYGHTSHGSQLTTGMTGLITFANNGGLGLGYSEDFFQSFHFLRKEQSPHNRQRPYFLTYD